MLAQGFAPSLAPTLAPASARVAADVPSVIERASGPNDPRFWFGGKVDPDLDLVRAPFHNHVWLYRALRLRAEAFLEGRFIVDDATREGLNPLPNHPLAQLFRAPSGMSADKFWTLLLHWLDLIGEVFLVLDRPLPSALPTRMWLAPGGGQWEIVKVDAYGVPMRWRTTAFGEAQEFAAWELVQITTPDPDNPRRGLGAAAVGRVGIEGAILAKSYNTNFFKNGAEPGGLITTPKVTTAAQRREIWRDWEEKHMGVSRAWRPGILWGGMDYKSVAPSHEDMQFLQQFEWERDETGALFGIPRLLFNATENTPRALAEAEIERFWQLTMLPLQRLILGALDAQLFMTVEGGRLRPAFDNSGIAALQGDVEQKWKVATEMLANGLPFVLANERLKLGITARFPGDDVSWRPMSLVPAETLLAGPEEPAPADTEEAPPGTEGVETDGPAEDDWLLTDDAEVPEARTARFAVHLAGLPRVERGKSEAADRLQRQWDKTVLKPGIRKVHGTMLGFLKQLAEHQLARFDAYFKGRDRAAGAGVVTRVVTADDVEAVLFNSPEWKDILAQLYRPTITAVGQLAVVFTEQELVQMLGPQATGDAVADALREVIEARVQRVKVTVDTARADLAKTLNDGIAANDSLAALRTRIEAVAEEFRRPRGRSLMIARTETGTVANGMRFQMAHGHKVEFHWWKTARDELVRPSHQKAEHDSLAHPVRVGEPFSNGLLYPLDPNGAASEVISCRCLAIILPPPKPKALAPVGGGVANRLLARLQTVAEAAARAGRLHGGGR